MCATEDFGFFEEDDERVDDNETDDEVDDD
jgi:hypothetical protein